jgi:hypothetical protein
MQLMDFVADLVEAVKKTEDPNAPLKAGDWCKFCPAAGTCPALAASAVSAAQAEFSSGAVVLKEPSRLSGSELSRVLANADLIETWCRQVKKFAHDEAIAGRIPPGWKLVDTRATRRWTDEAAALAALRAAGVEDEAILTVPELKSVAQAEKAVGKKLFASFSSFVESRSSGVTLAPESDRRPAVRPEAAEEFA